MSGTNTAGSSSASKMWRHRLTLSPLSPILLLYVVLAVALSFALPLGEAADEVSHRGYVAELTANHRLPTASGPAAGESFEPPLYYTIVSILTAWIPHQDLVVQANPDFSVTRANPPNVLLHPLSEALPYSNDAWAWHAMRLVSVALGALTIWAAYRLAKESFPERPEVAWGAAGFAGFLPSFLLVSAVVTSDSLIILLATLITWQWVRLLRRPLVLRDAAVLGGLLGLAALAKSTGFLLWGISGLVFIWLARSPLTRRRAIGYLMLTLTLALVIVSPWLLYNLWLDGDIFASARLIALHKRVEPVTLASWGRYASSMYTSFWGRFGGASHIGLPAGLYLGLGLVPLLAAAGLLRRRQNTPAGHAQAGERQILALFAIVVLTLMASHMRFTMSIAGADLARQVFSALGVVAVTTALGVSRLTRRSAAAVALLCAGMALFAILFVAVVAATFAGRPQDLSKLPSLANTVQADFGDQIRVSGYQLEDQTNAPKPQIEVTVYWQALSQPRDQYWLLLRLVGPQGIVAARDGVPANGAVTTDRWQSGQGFVSHHTVTVPPDIPAGTYQIEMGLHPQGRWQWLPVGGQDMMLLELVDIKR